MEHRSQMVVGGGNGVGGGYPGRAHFRDAIRQGKYLVVILVRSMKMSGEERAHDALGLEMR